MPRRSTAPDKAETADSAKKQSDKSISLSIVKASTILNVVAEDEGGIGLSGVAQRTGLSTTVCARMLHTLESVGYITRSADTGRYRLGLAILELAQSARLQNPINQRAASLLKKIADKTGDVAILMTEDRGEAVCLDRVDGEYPLIGRSNQVGNRLPLHTGGASFALLAFNTDDFVDAYLSLPLEKITPYTITEPAAVRARIAEARRLGYTVGDEDQALHTVAVGVPLFSPEGVLVAAMSVGGIKQRFDSKRCAELGQFIIEKAREFSKSLI